MLGWKITSNGEYKLKMQMLSSEEEQLIGWIDDRYRESAAARILDERESFELIFRLIEGYGKETGTYIAQDQREYISHAAFASIYGFGFLDELLRDSEIEEISICGPQKPVYVYIRNSGWKTVNAQFSTHAAISEAINKMAAAIGRRITYQNPRIDAILPDGSRLHGSLPPISDGEITIRKFMQEPFAPPELVSGGTYSIDTMALLALLMQSDSSLLIAGNTASGKTTTLNSLFSFVPLNERVVITEETPEISIPHKHAIRLTANNEMGISMKDIIYDTLRMRPDRMIVGEARSKNEAEALFDVLLAGQARASYATMHAQSSRELVSRIRNYGISQSDLGSVDAIIIQKRIMIYDSKKRKNIETRKMAELAFFEKDEIKTAIRREGNKMKAEKKNVEAFKRRIGEKLEMSEKEIEEELKGRKILLSKRDSFWEFFERVQKKLYSLG